MVARLEIGYWLEEPEGMDMGMHRHRRSTYLLVGGSFLLCACNSVLGFQEGFPYPPKDDAGDASTDVNADGSSLVGVATDFNSANSSFRWTLARGVEDFTGEVGIDISGISADASTLVGTMSNGVRQSAYRWTAGSGRRSRPRR